MLEVSLELFEEVVSCLEDPVLPIQQTRKLIRDADALVDIDAILSSSDEIAHAANAWKTLIQSFSDGLVQLKNSRKIDTLDQCEAVAKCTISIVNSLLKGSEISTPVSPNRRWRDDELWKGAPACPHALFEQFQWSSHCQAISDFITTAAFCGTDKSIEFPNGRLLDTSHHRIVAFQCIQTLLFFVCATVLRGAPFTEHVVPLPRKLVLLRRSKSENKSIQHMAADAVHKFQTEIVNLKKIQPQKSPPHSHVKLQIAVPKRASVSTPHRRRSLNASQEYQGSAVLDESASSILEPHNVAPGLRVLHDVQVFERDAQVVSAVLSDDYRLLLRSHLFLCCSCVDRQVFCHR